ncbi:hypothetical protein ACQKWADRAFT_298857 [Trichoderma austrokoningii]
MPPAANDTTSDGEKPIPLRFKFSRRFYEPILLEAVLKKIRPTGFSATQHEPNTMNDNADSAEQTFKCFVNRLAQVCDNIRGSYGATVTGIAVLEEPEGIHYIVGGNNRKKSELKNVEDFVKQLLKMMSKSKKKPTNTAFPIQREALWHILRFNKQRIKYYLAGAVKHLEECIKDYDRRHAQTPLASDAFRFRGQLAELKEILVFQKDGELIKLDESQYFSSCERVFLFIDDNQRLKLGDSISEQAREGQMDSSEPWLELRHFLGRLHSYHLAVETMLRARRLWGRLWDDIKVTAIPSATTIPHPLYNMTPNANKIIGRLTSAEDLMETYRNRAAMLQERGLDEKILEECSSSSQTHMVHAEVLVLDHVLSYLQDTEDAQFYNGWRYIGTSKPICRLCNYYFMTHPSGIQVRESHTNLYPHWRVPDIFDDSKMAQVEAHLRAIIEKTRADAVRSLMSQTSQGRRYDSNSFSELPPPFASLTTETPSISDLNSRFPALNIITEEDDQSAAREEEEEEEEVIIPAFWGRKSVVSRR